MALLTEFNQLLMEMGPGLRFFIGVLSLLFLLERWFTQKIANQHLRFGLFSQLLFFCLMCQVVLLDRTPGGLVCCLVW